MGETGERKVLCEQTRMLMNNSKITREAQGQIREDLSERSVCQTDEPMYKNAIGGVGCGMSGPRIAKSPELATHVNGAVVSAQIIDLSMETSVECREGLQSAHTTPGAGASNGIGLIRRGVSSEHSNRGYEHGVA